MDLERIIALRYSNPPEYADELMNAALALCTRPGDVERTAHTLNTLIQEIAAWRLGNAYSSSPAPSPQPA